MAKAIKRTKTVLKLALLLILAYLILMPIFKINNYLFVKEVQAIQKTIVEQRQVAESVELTALTDTIIDTNKQIAKLRVYQDIDVLKPFFCTEFAKTEFVK